MEEINAEWLKRHLSSDRGLKADLSARTGISPDKISKILSGVRQVQATEAPLIYGFFKGQEPDVEPDDQKWQDLRNLWPQLSEADREFLRNSAKAQIDARHQPQQQSDEEPQ